MELSKKQKLWCNQHGGRTYRDVYVENGIPGIYLQLPGYQQLFKPIPTDDYLEIKRKKLGEYSFIEIVVDKYSK